MLVALGDLKEGSSFSFDGHGRLHLIFPDDSVILDGSEGLCASGPKEIPPAKTEARMWLDRHAGRA